MRSALLAMLSCAFVVTGVGPARGQAIGLLTGVWRGEKSEPKSFQVNSNGTYQITWYNSRTEEGTVTLSSSGNTLRIALRATSGPDNGRTRRGIYSLENEGGRPKLTIYISKPDGEEPKSKKKDPGRIEEWKVYQ